MTYAKITDGVLEFYPSTKSEAFAEAKGYKPFIAVAAPSCYHVKGYEDTGESIITTWTLPNLDTLKAAVTAQADAVKDAALAATETLEVEDIGTVIWNTRAELNVSGSALLIAKGAIESVEYTLADDTSATFGEAELLAVSGVMATHVNGIYSSNRALKADVAACESSADLLALAVERGLV